MKTMFKKTLVAAALAGIGFNAFAADVATNVVNVSAQGSIATPKVDAGALEIALEAAYAVGDTVRITFDAGTLTDAPLTLTTDAVVAPAHPVTFGRIALEANSVTYRVTEIVSGGADHGNLVFDAGDLKFNSASVVAAGKVNATYAAFIGSSTAPLDSPVEYNDDEDLTSGAIFNVRNQFAATVSATTGRLDAMLDVAADRQAFVGGATTDVLTIDLDNNDTDAGFVDKGNTAFTLRGDFSWIDTAALAEAVTVDCSDDAVGTPVATASTFTFTCNAASTGAVVTFDIDQDGEAVPVNPTSFTLDVNHAYGAGSSALAQTNINAGAWGVNGSVVTVPYMVYGTVGAKAFSQVLRVTNNGSQTGTIYADVWGTDADGKSIKVLTNEVVGTSHPQATANVAGALRAKMEAAGYGNGTYAIRLITDVKADTVSVYSAYVDNVTSERAIVNNDSPVAATRVINP